MSPTRRWEVSPIEDVEWYRSESDWMWSNTRVRSRVTTRTPVLAKAIVEM